MEVTMDQEHLVVGNLKYVQFTSSLSNFVEGEILSEGWQLSAGAMEKLIPKKKYLLHFNKVLHEAIISSFQEALKEMLEPAELPKMWDILYQEKNNCTEYGKDNGPCSNSHLALLNLKMKYKNSLKSAIELKLQKIEEIKKHLNLDKLAFLKKVAELETIKERCRNSSDVLESLDSMSF